MRLSEEAGRQSLLLEWLADEESRHWDIRPFYANVEQGARLAFEDGKNLERKGLLQHFYRHGDGRIEVTLSSEGREKAETLKSTWSDKAQRSWASRSALVKWLYDMDATLNYSRSRMPREFIDQTTSNYFGKPFQQNDIKQATLWLENKGLLSCQTIEESADLISAYLTTSGVDCAERFGSDVRRYVDAKDRPVLAQNWTLNNNSGQIQVSTAAGATNAMSTVPEARELLASLDRLVQLIAVEDEELQQLYDDVVVDLNSNQLSETRLKRLLHHGKQLASVAGNASLAALVTAASDDVLSEFGRLFHK